LSRYVVAVEEAHSVCRDKGDTCTSLLPLSFQVPNINHANSVLSRNYSDLYTFLSPLIVSYSSVRHQISFLSLLLFCLILLQAVLLFDI
jgi:hypothetical protein